MANTILAIRLRTLLSLGYILVFSLMILIAMLTYSAYSSLIESADWVEHTNEVIAEARLAEKLIIDMETGQRGYLITGSENYLEPYRSGINDFNALIAQLSDQVSDNPAQQLLLQEIKYIHGEWINSVALPEISLRREKSRKSNDADELQDLVMEGAGKVLIDSLRGDFAIFIEAERRLLAIRGGVTDAAAKTSARIILFGTVIAILLGIIAMIYSSRIIIDQVGGEPIDIARATDQIASGNLDIELDSNSGIGRSVHLMLQSLKGASNRADRVASGDFSSELITRSEHDQLGLALDTMTQTLQEAQISSEKESWLKVGAVQLGNLLLGEQNQAELSRSLIKFLAKYVSAPMAALYMLDEEGQELVLSGTYAFEENGNPIERIKLGKGIAGQAALDNEITSVTNIPSNYIKIESALGESPPQNVAAFPFSYEGALMGVMEFATFKPFSENELSFLRRATDRIGITFNSAISRKKMAELLQETQEQSNVLTKQTEMLQTQQEDLKSSNEELELANKYKSEFLANMSHELRTPLNAIIGYSEMLEEEAQEQGQEDYVQDLQKIHGAGRHLLALINDVLDLSKIEAGQTEIYIEHFDLNELIQDSVNTLTPLAEKNKNEILVNLADGIGEIASDQTKLRQILFNLLSNACKFTQNGTITLTARQIQKSGLDVLEIEVADEGIGMRSDQLEKIFRPFIQADSSTTREYGGTGLGLAITKRFCGLLEGSINVTSTPDLGTTFTVTLPLNLEQGDEPTVKIRAKSGNDSILVKQDIDGPLLDTKNTVLIIDDDPAVQELLARYLIREGYGVATASSGKEGLSMAAEISPTLITLDVMMPEMDGWEVLATLKADPDLANIPVVMASIQADIKKGMALGAVDYLVKPIDKNRLLKALDKYRNAADPMAVLVVDDDESMQDIFKKTLSGEGWKISCAGDGQIAMAQIADALPDIIILDLMMPNMDGFEVVERLQSNDQWRQIPIIVITAKDLSAEDYKRLNGGIESIVEKGNDIDSLLEKIFGSLDLVSDNNKG